MKKEWTKTLNFKPSILYKNDLIKLYSIISESDLIQESSFNYLQVKNGEHSIDFSSFDEFLKEVSNLDVNELTICFETRNKDYTQRNSIRFYLNKSYLSCDISSTNEIWFLGKIEQLNKFFQTKKRWYSSFFWIKYFFPFLGTLGLSNG